MTLEEREQLKVLLQPALNGWVKEQVAASKGRMWCEETVGADGVTYAAFGWRTQGH
jgi:hypothetical protein